MFTGGGKIVQVSDENLAESPDQVARQYLEQLTCAVAATKTGSYFELPPSCRSQMSKYMMDTVAAFENRSLVENEINFIHTWLNLRDRNLGESLLAKRIATLPPAERGNSKFAKMMLLGMMASTMRLENALEDMQEEIESVGDDVAEMEEDVGDMNEGFGFEE